MKKELNKTYDPSSVEEKLYENWLEKKYFHAEIDKTKVPYTIVIPPPNITGQLHIGHAVDNTIQDILIRYKRMDGYNALWVPGTDHASISTEMKIVEKMAKDGVTKADIGREEFLKLAWEWKEEYGGRIIEQLKKLGCSLDFDRERFTMDNGLSHAVQEVFIRLYNEGYIYRGEKIINWCPECKTTISDAEVEHEDRQDNFYHVKYPFADGNGYLEVATTRPETMLGDVAVAVNPDDERYKGLVGKSVILPLLNKEIPIIADEYVEKDFGTGVVKITPAHDPNDFLVGERHNLPRPNVMNDDGTMNENAGEYNGLDRYEARKRIVKKLQEDDLLIKIDPLSHAVGTHERCNTIIEPLIKLQWFVKMDELAKPAIDVVNTGELKFIPDRYSKVYLNWLYNIRDWCISRQLWWGHRIPAYYCDCGHLEVSAEKPEKCSKCGNTNMIQDEDTLDTWFSSALWPFSTLGWPEDTEDLKHFYPTSTLVTSYDIIFFWVVRMVFSGLKQTGKCPFKDVVIHGLVRDSEGRKFSKSLGNGVDPLEAIEKYGADALRLTLISGISPGNDMRFYYEKVENSRNFLNKLWNASRFVLMNFEDGEENISISLDELTPADKWIISKANTLAKSVRVNLDDYDLSLAVTKVYDFLWDEYCDWYIEMVKPRLYNKEDKTRGAALYTLKTVLIEALKLLHPFMPFITEELFLSIVDDEETIMLSEFPKYMDKLSFPKEEKEIEMIKYAVRGIRNLRAEMNVAPSKKVKVILVTEDSEIENIFNDGRVFFQTLGYASELVIQKDKVGVGEDFVSVIIEKGTMYMPFAELVDIEKEIERLSKEKDKLQSEVDRVVKKLQNEGFLAKAPESLINEEKGKQARYEEMLKQVCERLEVLCK